MNQLRFNPNQVEPVASGVDDEDSSAFLDQYEVLRPDGRASKYKYRNLNTAETKTEVLEDYLTKFQEMVNVIQGKEKIDGDPDPAAPFDMVIFLDKSARPLSWMMSELWDEFASPVTNEHGQRVIPPMPPRKFLNIDRLTWRQDSEVAGEFHNITESDIAALRAIFEVGNQNLLDGSAETPKRILIVDELSESGDTQRVAKELLDHASHGAVVKTLAYMPGIKKDASWGVDYEFPLFPTWYPHKRDDGTHAEEGRGVLDPVVWDAESSLAAPRRKNKFLSTPPEYVFSTKEKAERFDLLKELEQLRDAEESPENLERQQQIQQRLGSMAIGYVARDPKAEMLRRDIKRLARDFKARRLFPALTGDREEIAGLPADEYYNLRRQRIANAARKPLYTRN